MYVVTKLFVFLFRDFDEQISFCFSHSGLERKLKAGDEKLDEITKEKAQLKNDISDMRKSTGDSSAQLTKMNEDLTQKERYSPKMF